MSVCDEGWGGPDEWGEEVFCPCALTYGGAGLRVCGCSLGLWLERWENKPNTPPDPCPDASALKSRRENPALVLAAVPKEPDYEFITRELEYWEDRLRDYYEKEFQ